VVVVVVVVVVLVVVVRVEPLSLYRRVNGNELSLLYKASYVSYTWVYLYLSGRALGLGLGLGVNPLKVPCAPK